MYLAMVVIVVSIGVGLAMGGLDLVFSWIVDRTILR